MSTTLVTTSGRTRTVSGMASTAIVLTVPGPHGDREVRLRHETKAPAKAARRSESALQLDDVQQQRFQSLRSWRATTAKEQAVPAYVVFNDKTLAAIAERKPATMVELSTISGVGEAKLERYGDAVLEVLAAS